MSVTIKHPGGAAKYNLLGAFSNDRGEIALILKGVSTGSSCVACFYGDGLVWTLYPGKLPQKVGTDFIYRRKQ